MQPGPSWEKKKFKCREKKLLTDYFRFSIYVVDAPI
jgi:hypothetical protein